MELRKIDELLADNEYPGRGIAAGLSEDGENAVIIYFIMGRSSNSRNRIFVSDNEGIRTKAFDEAKLEDPSLIIYAPVRVLGNSTIVTNGDQTDTVYEGMKNGMTFEESLRSRRFEPDAPNYTPRISALVTAAEGELQYAISILKSADGCPDGDERFLFSYSGIKPGTGHFISTYRHNGNPLPSFEGEPVRVALEGTIDELSERVWNSLNRENKVSLFTRFISLKNGKTETRIINIHQEVPNQA